MCKLLLVLVYLAELWSCETDVSPWPGHFVLRPGLRFLQYIHCLKQIGESAPWHGLGFPVGISMLFVPGSVAHLYQAQAATVLAYKGVQMGITLDLHTAELVTKETYCQSTFSLCCHLNRRYVKIAG